MQKALWLAAVMTVGIASPAIARGTSSQSAQSGTVSQQERQQIDNFAKSYQDAWNSKDMDRLSRMYTAKAKPSENLGQDELRDATITVDVVAAEPIAKNTYLIDQQSRVSGASDPSLNGETRRISVLKREGKDFKIVAEREVTVQPAGSGGAGMMGNTQQQRQQPGTGGSGSETCPCATMGAGQMNAKNCPCAMRGGMGGSGDAGMHEMEPGMGGGGDAGMHEMEPGMGGSGQMGTDQDQMNNPQPRGDSEMAQPPSGTKPPTPDVPRMQQHK